MNPVLVNAGNRTKDELHVYEYVGRPAIAPDEKPLMTLQRGEKFSLSGLLGKPIVLTCTYDHAGDDEYVGQPQVTVTDPPKAE